MVLVDFKVYFQGQKGPIWTFVIYLGQYLRNGACCDQCLYEVHIRNIQTKRANVVIELYVLYIKLIIQHIMILSRAQRNLTICF